MTINDAPKYKVGDTRPPTLTEVMLDAEFLLELRDGNQTLLNFLDVDKMLQIADYVIQEPKFSDSPHRCFQLPYLACEVFTTDCSAVTAVLFNEVTPNLADIGYNLKQLEMVQFEKQSKYVLMDKFVSFYEQPDPHLKHQVRFLNPTLGGYLNKIFSFWLIKRPETFLKYVIAKKDFVQNLFNHLYLTQCVTDLLSRLCTVPDIKGVPETEYAELRTDII